jgi:uncharacterized protein with PQ loop repeat
MKKYLEDPVLNLTASALRLLHWMMMLFAAICVGASMLIAFALLVSTGDVLNLKDANDVTVVAIMPAGAIMCYLAARILKLLRYIVLSVGSGQPLTEVNAQRLRTMGWLTLAIQGTLVLTAIILAVDNHTTLLDFDTGFGLVESILSAAVLFILARVFEQGAKMQDDLEGTV